MPTLNWIGKDKVINHHQDVPYKILEKQYTYKDGQESDAPSENKIIHGDNLEALKSLLPEYEGKIKCIYIDPPYNTGNEGWVYNDNVNDPKLKKWLGQVVGKESEDLSRHDKWLCMMYPRLKLLKKLLNSEGSLVISIGYHEVFNLMQVVNELFGNKQIACVTIQTSGGKPSGAFNYQHEYLIFVLPKDFEGNPMTFTGGKQRSPYEGLTLATFTKEQRPNQTYPIYIDDNCKLIGVGLSLQERIRNGNYTDPIEEFEYNFSEAPDSSVAVWPITSKGKDCVWRLSPKRLLEDWTKGFIKISPNKQKAAKNKFSVQYLPEGVIKKIASGVLEVNGTEENSPTLIFGENKTEGNSIPSLWLEKGFYTVKGTTLLNELFNGKVFNYPKPLFLISEILTALTNPNDIVLDSFAGSGTTAEAVLNLNNDGGNRKFILIEMEDYASVLTAERVKKVINGYNDQVGTGGDFSYYELGKPIFLDNEMLNEEIGKVKIEEYVWFSETKLPYQLQEENYLLGTKDQTAYYFYYNTSGITTLDESFLRTLKTKANQYIIYADNCLLTKEIMQKYNIIFKKIPRDITRF